MEIIYNYSFSQDLVFKNKQKKFAFLGSQS